MELDIRGLGISIFDGLDVEMTSWLIEKIGGGKA